MKKQAKILALILSLCLIFGVIVATTAFADTAPVETNQLDKSYLSSTTNTITHGTTCDFVAGNYEDKTVSDKTYQGGTYSGFRTHSRYLMATDFDTVYDSINPDAKRTNIYQEVRPIFSGSSQYRYSDSGFASASLDYYVVDFDMAATQYLIYFNTPYFVDRDGDSKCDNRLSENTHLGYVSSSGDAAENEAFTHALGTFERDSNGDIVAINVDAIFFMEYDGASYFTRYLQSELQVSTTYPANTASEIDEIEYYSLEIEDAAAIQNMTYHVAYADGAGVWFPTNNNSGNLHLDLFKFDTFGQGGKYYIAGNVKGNVYLSNEINVWDHITIIVAYNEIGDTYYSNGYLLLNGELVLTTGSSATTAYNITNGGRAQFLLTRGNSDLKYDPANYTPAKSSGASFSIAFDNWTSNKYSENYVSTDYVGLDDYVQSIQTGANNVAYTDCVDVVYDADYVSPNAYAASVDGKPYSNINEAVKHIGDASEVIIAKDILDYTPAKGVTNFTVSLLNGAKFSLSEGAKATLYAEPGENGYKVRPYGPQDVVEFDYYYGDEKIGEGAGNRLLGMVLDSSVILDRAAQDAYIITDRTNGEYLAITSDEVTWYWNLGWDEEEEIYIVTDTFQPIDTDILDAFSDELDYIKDDLGSDRLIVKGVVETEEKTAFGYMVVDYINGAERVVPNAKGNYDYLSVDYTAVALAKAFREDLLSAANKNKTIVLTCGNLLDVDGSDGDNAESIKGFDIYADSRQVLKDQYTIPAGSNVTLDLNGRTLVNGSILSKLLDKDYSNVTFRISDGATFTVYSSVPGGEIIHSIFGTNATGWTDYLVGTVFNMGGNVKTATLNLGRYKNPNTGAIADGNNLRITGSGIVNQDTNANATDIDININGGYYYTTARTMQGMFRLSAANTTVNIQNAELVYNHHAFSVFNFNYNGGTAASSLPNRVLNINNSTVIAVNYSNGNYLDLFGASGVEAINVTNSTVIGTNTATAGTLTVGNGCVLVGSKWNTATYDGVETATGPDTTVSFTAHYNYQHKSNLAGTTETNDNWHIVKYTTIQDTSKSGSAQWTCDAEIVDAVGEGSVVTEGTVTTTIGYKYAEFQVFNYSSTQLCYAMSDRFYELITKDYALSAPIYTYDPDNMPETFVSVTYNYTNADNVPKSDVEYYIKGAAVSNPSVALRESNGWYALGAGPDSWTLANGTVITEDTVATPVESKLVPTAAVQAKYSVGTASYVKFKLYLPEYQDAEGNNIPLPEGVSDISVYKYNGTAKINPGAYVQVAADGTKMRSYETGEMTPAYFDSTNLGDFIINFNVTIGGVTTPCTQRVELSTVQYATDILEQRNGTVNGKKDVMWGYAYLNYANTTFKAVKGTDLEGAQALLTRYVNETANWGTQEKPDSVAIRWAAYKAEMDNKVATTNLDWSGLEGYVKGFAWVYSMEKPHLVAILDYSKTTADYSLYDNAGAGSGATLKKDANLANRIYSFNFQGQSETFNGNASYYYRTWNRAGLVSGGTAAAGPYEHVHIWASSKGINTLSADSFNIILYSYDEKGEKDADNAKNEVARGQYSMVEYIKWARANVGTETTQTDVDTAESAYLLALAFRDFKNYVPEDAQ